VLHPAAHSKQLGDAVITIIFPFVFWKAEHLIHGITLLHEELTVICGRPPYCLCSIVHKDVHPRVILNDMVAEINQRPQMPKVHTIYMQLVTKQTWPCVHSEVLCSQVWEPGCDNHVCTCAQEFHSNLEADLGTATSHKCGLSSEINIEYPLFDIHSMAFFADRGAFGIGFGI